jgi:signal peptidase II
MSGVKMSGSGMQESTGNAGSRWWWLAFAVLAGDRATKFAIERYTSVFFRRPIFSDIVYLVHDQNSGMAFGVFSNSNSPLVSPLLLAGAVIMIAALAWLLVTGRAGGALAHTGLAMILGGAAGNALDRVIHGGVTDFLEVRLGSYVWPAFNVADSAISLGAVLVLIELLFGGANRTQLPDAKRD